MGIRVACVAVLAVASIAVAARGGDDQTTPKGANLSTIRCPLEPTGKTGPDGQPQYAPAKDAFDTATLIDLPLVDPSPGVRAHGPIHRAGPTRAVVARQFPISIDSKSFEALARDPQIQARARQIREDLGNPATILLGVDRLDYTKGITHRLQAYGELLAEGRLDVEHVTLVQVANPSRERVKAYMELRDDIELTVGRINGDFGTISHKAISYHHRGYTREEMVALYLAADVMLVTALRDGMNLVAKEYVAARSDERGALVLSEFTGAADELTAALLVNPHDIDGMKDAIVAAATIEPREARKRMRSLRRRVLTHDVAAWSSSFLAALRSTGA